MSHCWLLRLDIAQSGAPNEQVRPSFRVDMLRDAERVPGAFQQTMPQGPVKKWDVQVVAAKGGTLAERSYDDLLQADFVSTHQATGKHVYFAILLGTRGSMKGSTGANSLSAQLAVSGCVESHFSETEPVTGFSPCKVTSPAGPSALMGRSLRASLTASGAGFLSAVSAGRYSSR